MVVDIVAPHSQRTITYSKTNLEGTATLDTDSAFKIGSLTKTFTVLLLADMAIKGEMKLTAPISMYLLKSAKVPSRNGKQIRLNDLAMHHSGLLRNVDG